MQVSPCSFLHRLLEVLWAPQRAHRTTIPAESLKKLTMSAWPLGSSTSSLMAGACPKHFARLSGCAFLVVDRQLMHSHLSRLKRHWWSSVFKETPCFPTKRRLVGGASGLSPYSGEVLS